RRPGFAPLSTGECDRPMRRLIAALHLPESMLAALADRQQRVVLAQFQPHAAVVVAVADDPLDAIDGDQHAAIDLPEARRIELLAQFLDRLADERLESRRQHARV